MNHPPKEGSGISKRENFIDAFRSCGFECCKCAKYSNVGATFCQKTGPFRGLFWIYENEDFVIDIHNLYIVDDFVMPLDSFWSKYIEIFSSYVINGNGECIAPYQNITSNSLLITDSHNAKLRFSLHANSPYISVGVSFKKQMIKKFITDRAEMTRKDAVHIFLTTRQFVTQKIAPIANEIINYKGKGIAAELFFEAKSKEWLSIVLNEYDKRSEKKSLSYEDELSIEAVARYISDHFTTDISQDFLEEIAMMSKTKLKTGFKQKYNMSMTEYIQRKRINTGEYLLLTTDMLIADVAQAVGYACAGRFTDLFKRYKGMYPKNIRKLKNTIPDICSCEKE